MSSTTPNLNRERIAQTAIAIADKEGFAAVTIRRLAAELNAGAMSLYHYVKNKDDLLALMDDQLMAEMLLSEQLEDWRSALLAIARQTRAVLVRHPWALMTMLSVPPGLNTIRHMEECLHALSNTQLTTPQKLDLLRLVDDFVIGHTLRHGAIRPEAPPSLVALALKSGEFPLLTQAYESGLLQSKAPEQSFEEGVKAILAGAEQWVAT
jgi:AcrR family transcriptional regulator